MKAGVKMSKKEKIAYLIAAVAVIALFSFILILFGPDKPEQTGKPPAAVTYTEYTYLTDYGEDDTGVSSQGAGTGTVTLSKKAVVISHYPSSAGNAYAELNGNVPGFTQSDVTTKAFESYSRLDLYGRCGVAYANICKQIMPKEERGDISSVKPTGWHSVQYDFIDRKSLFNRCHLIGFQLAGENANELNLITGTSYMNVDGMLPFENEIAEYVKSTGNHVLYRVTPVFDGVNLVADGVQMEAYSVEDSGEGVCFNVFCFNIQPGIVIDYLTGDSRLAKKGDGYVYSSFTKPAAVTVTAKTAVKSGEKKKYVVNTYRKKFHLPSCESVSGINSQNKKTVVDTRENLVSQGYSPCGSCKP